MERHDPAGLDALTGRPVRSSSGDDGTSQVPGGPRCEHAALLDPGEASAPALLFVGAPVLPSALKTESALTSRNDFEAHSRGLLTPCVRFAAEVALGPRNTRFPAGRYTFAERVFPAGSVRKFQLTHPPSPGFAWRTFSLIKIAR